MVKDKLKLIITSLVVSLLFTASSTTLHAENQIERNCILSLTKT